MKPAAAKTPAKTSAKAQALPGKATPQTGARVAATVTKKATPARPKTVAARKPTPTPAKPPAAKPKNLPMPIAAAAPAPIAIKKDPKLAHNWKTKKPEELSDAEVIAMPDDEYMNDKQLAFFRLKLVQLKDDILLNADETTEHLRKDTVVVPDPADRATIEEEHALELRTRDRERKLLKKIEQSIARIDAGDYGYCDETGEPIGVPRLLARPTATLSLEAQQRRELKQKMFGD
ncbi:MAG: RNA polymerase-binding protein DksA [Burkholderiaceae bacterium]